MTVWWFSIVLNSSFIFPFNVSIFSRYFLFIFVLVNSFYIFQFLFPVGPCSYFHREQRKETKRRQIEKEAKRKKCLLISFLLFLFLSLCPQLLPSTLIAIPFSPSYDILSDSRWNQTNEGKKWYSWGEGNRTPSKMEIEVKKTTKKHANIANNFHFFPYRF